MGTQENGGNGTQSETAAAMTEIMPRTKGPRTATGKTRASRNATRHGVLSKAVLLKDESPAEYRELLDGLRETFQPEGALEDLLVEKLATSSWRLRRVLMAESSEVQRNVESYEWQQRNLRNEECSRFDISKSFSFPGLIHQVQNPAVLQRCVEMLEELKENIGSRGFEEDADNLILDAIYGERDERLSRNDVFDDYEAWLNTSVASVEEREREGYAAPEQCQQHVIHAIEKEILRLRRYQKDHAAFQTARTRLEVQSRHVPTTPEMDRLLRYETTLERSFDRTLSQLERAQRLRRGQPVPPEVKVRVTQEP